MLRADCPAPSSPASCRTSATLLIMTRKLTQRELRNESGKIMRELDRGEDFVVTRNGVPVGELRPIQRRQFVSRETVAKLFSGAPSLDYEQFRADLDADLDPSPREWPDS